MKKTRYIAHAGLVAALHATVTIAVIHMPTQLGWGFVQLRVSEALTVLAALTPAAIPGLALGTAIANATLLAQVGAVAMLDVTLGSAATLLGAVWTWRFRRNTALALLGPVVANALIVPAYLPILFGAIGLEYIPFLGVDAGSGALAVYGAGVITIGIGQAVVVYGLGAPLLALLKRRIRDDPDV